MIRSLRIDNLRIFSGEYEFPLKKFNLLFGNNGVGKSTIVEAIQLGITGNTDRINSINTAEVVQQVKTFGTSNLSIKIFRDNETLPIEFNNDGPTSTFSELLKKFYGKEIKKGPTARNLLTTLFSTHNIITQEKIIRLLDSESEDAFHRSITGMIAGQKLTERWQTIKNLKDVLRREVNGVDNRIRGLEEERTGIAERLKDLRSISETEFTERYQETALLFRTERISISTEPEDMSLDHIRKWIQDSTITIEAMKNSFLTIDQLNIENRDLDVSDLNRYLSSTRKDREGLEKSKNGLVKKMQNIEKENQLLSNAKMKINETMKQLEHSIRERKNQLSGLKKIDEWRPEILADYRTKKIQQELTLAKSRIDSLQEARLIIHELPSIDVHESKSKDLIVSKKELQRLNMLIKDIKTSLEKQRIKQVKLKEEYEKWQKMQDKQAVIYEKLNEMAKNILASVETSKCPTCGTDFKDKEALKEAVDQNITDIRSRLMIKVPEQFEKSSIFEAEIAKQQEKLDEHLKKYTAIVKEIDDTKTMFFLWLEKASLVTSILNEADVAKLERPSEETLRLFLSHIKDLKLENLLQIAQGNYSDLKASLMSAWAGLRKNDYEDQSAFLFEEFEISKEIVERLQDESAWEDSLVGLRNSIKGEKAKKEEKGKQLDQKSKKIEENDIEHKECNISLNKYETTIEKHKASIKNLTLLINEIKKLRSYYAISEDSIDIKKSRVAVDELSARINALEKSVIATIAAHKDRSQHEKRLKQLEGKIKNEREKIKLMNKIHTNISSTTTLECRIHNEWGQYENKINDFFVKLHSPPDYKEIKLTNSSEAFALKVVTRVEEDPKPATILSSGQRAALAISIFWTLNLYGKDIIPPIMLMDEPIQQIDDLNSLNFLDALRWIMEKSDRQVVVSTANSRVAGLIRRKFSYLEDEYNELQIERHSDTPPIIKCYDSYGKIVSEHGSDLKSA